MKKFNLAIIILLLVFQTVLSPISVFATESEPIASSEGNDVNTSSTDETTVTSPVTLQEGETDNSEPPLIPPTTTEEEATGDNSGEKLPEDGVEEGVDNPAEDATNSDDQTPPMVKPLNETPTDLTESARLDVFELKINGDAVLPPEFTTELAQNQQAQGKFIFKVDFPDDVKAGDFFTYALPASLIDFNSAFNGKRGATADSPAFEWNTAGNLVTVTITEDPSADIAGSIDVGFEMNFTSGFNLAGNNLEQELVIPTAGKGTDSVKLTFLPSSNGDKMVSKQSKGVTINSGERTIDWEVWINRAGKNLTNATVQDTPGTGHEIVPNSVTVETYEVGLNGVASTATEAPQTKINFEDIALNGRYAYKITYQTVVNLPITEQEGQKTFANSITLIDPNFGDSDSKTASTTYGKALEKSKDSSKNSNNYVSSWEVRFNYNQAAIGQANAWIEDTLSDGHVIDLNTIKVYEMTVDDTGKATGAGTEINATNYTVNPVTKGFKLTFNNDIANAYRITYDAKLTDNFYSDSTITTVTNKVTSGTVSQAKTGTHTLEEGILAKSRTVDTNKKEITWTITIKADNKSNDGTDIQGLTISDTFTEGSYNALHKLVDANNDGQIDVADITVSNMANQTIVLDANGFTLTGGTVAKGQTAVITYKTAYEILPDGSIYEQGYGNTAIANWTTDKPYSITKSAHYRPDSNSVHNGRKQGAYDYIEQVFNWDIKININKQTINNAVLEDTIGEGHEIIPGTFSIKEFTLTTPNNDEIGTEGADLDPSLYTLVVSPNNKSFTVTFANDLGAANNKVYIIKYQTKDSDNIIGIESDTKNDKTKAYTNTATFTTNVGGSSKTYNLPATSVTPGYVNQLITKESPSSSSSEEQLTWTLNINRSLSSLGATKVSDVPSENQLLLKDTIKVKKYNVSASTGTSVPSDWLNPTALGFTVTFPATGGFEIDFGQLNKEGYQVQYRTLVLGQEDDPYSNNAKIDFSFDTANNQEKEASYNDKFSFSASDADFSLTKGNLKFNKVGLNSLTGVKQPLPGVEFELVKMVKTTPYIVKTATSDKDGNVLFENINYAKYIVKEKNAPQGYILMNDYAIKLDAKSDTKLTENATKVIELVNNEQIDTANACPAFTLTVKDMDGHALANEAIKLVDSNGVTIDIGSTDNLGQITTIKRPGTSGPGTTVQAGTYTVKDAQDNELGRVIVKYGQHECHGEIQPINSCPLFTITVKDENTNPRPHVTVTLKDTTNHVITTVTTDSNGQFTIDKTTPSGKYKLYEGTQYLGEVHVTYQNGNCQDEIIQAPKCEKFELTIKNADGESVVDHTDVIIKDVNSNTIASLKTKDGKVEIKDLEPGVYSVFDKDGNKIGEFSSNIDCHAEVQQKPACERFTVELKDENNVLIKAGKDVVIKDKQGNVISTVIEADGSLTFVSKDVPAGKYDVYDNKVYLGEIVVSYKQICKVDLSIAPACPNFTLTINNMYGQPRVGVKVTFTDEDGVVVEANGSTEFITNNVGQITISNLLISPGKYMVKENGKTILGTVTAGNTCEAKIQPTPPVTNPTDPDNPNPEPEKPVDPNKPNPDPEKPVDPNKPNPDPEKPVDPNKPNPDPEKPVDPNKPNPDPEKPVDPNKPIPDPEKPVDPNKPTTPGNGGTSAQNVIDQGKQLPPYNPSNVTKNTLDAYKDFLNKYSKLSKDEQTEVAQAIDINKIKADAERLEAQLRAQGKLPQTDGANQTALVFVGLLLVAGAIWFMRRRTTEI